MKIDICNSKGFSIYTFDTTTHQALFHDSLFEKIFTKGVDWTPQRKGANNLTSVNVTYIPNAENYDAFNQLFIDYVRAKYKTFVIKSTMN